MSDPVFVEQERARNRQRMKAKRSTEEFRQWRRAKRKDPAYREKERLDGIRRKYKLSPEAYLAMIEEQQGACKICRQPEPTGKHLAIDHCHASGRVRGLLCSDCNTTLGKFNDSPDRFIAAANYLKENKHD
jgi:hypothetical protein